jgi:hypothetical protein
MPSPGALGHDWGEQLRCRCGATWEIHQETPKLCPTPRRNRRIGGRHEKGTENLSVSHEKAIEIFLRVVEEHAKPREQRSNYTAIGSEYGLSKCQVYTIVGRVRDIIIHFYDENGEPLHAEVPSAG